LIKRHVSSANRVAEQFKALGISLM